MNRIIGVVRCAVGAVVLGSIGFAQGNVEPGLDVSLFKAVKLTALGREGVFPNGRNGLAISTTVCNVGSVEVEWKAAMNRHHPFIATLVARDLGGRMEQVSDRSFVKHGFASLNSSMCGTCTPPVGAIGEWLGVGCSDTYDVAENGDRLELGPADEIDPWTGFWAKTCSHFDAGEPPVAAPANCDNKKSLNQQMVRAMGPVLHRVTVDDAELDEPSARFFVQSQYVVAKEAEALRSDNLGSRRIVPNWDGTQWTFAGKGGLVHDSVLLRWQGASVDSSTNGGDDGRVYVGVKVTGPVAGMYHYEYALHNRDNARGVAAVHIPICNGARVSGFGFHDVDDDPTNDWTMQRSETELVAGEPSNPLKWNSIFNVWFDSDAAPARAGLGLDAAAMGPGAASFTVASSAPLEVYNLWLGPGCAGATGTTPLLHTLDASPRATLGNRSFGLAVEGSAPNLPSLLLFGLRPGRRAVDTCTLYIGGTARRLSMVTADASGRAIHNLPIPPQLSLEGLGPNVQAVSFGGSAVRGNFDLSNGLRVRIGNSIPSCP
ncbi:MAG TPA: hypothetical protein ENJ09_04150 [Planctomycetes bacterium]|nr:hypothetical protein [Planctomycetota bacterium]